jgi:serine/threonine protein phosphatase PrpC
MPIDVTAVTDQGKVRKSNQDNFGVMNLGENRFRSLAQGHTFRMEMGFTGTILMVSDGMGGASGGEVAAELVIGGMKQFFESNAARLKMAFPYGVLREAVQHVNAMVWSKAVGDLKGMGATLTAVFFSEDTAYFAQVGDSRLYLIRDGFIYQVTRDQTLVQAMVEQGMISAEQAKFHRERNILTQAMGTHPTVNPVVGMVKIGLGDVITLCSDGLSGKVEGREMVSALVSAMGDVEMAANRLVNLANERGGEDNITIVMGRVKLKTGVNPFVRPRILEIPANGLWPDGSQLPISA